MNLEDLKEVSELIELGLKQSDEEFFLRKSYIA